MRAQDDNDLRKHRTVLWVRASDSAAHAAFVPRWTLAHSVRTPSAASTSERSPSRRAGVARRRCSSRRYSFSIVPASAVSVSTVKPGQSHTSGSQVADAGPGKSSIFAVLPQHGRSFGVTSQAQTRAGCVRPGPAPDPARCAHPAFPVHRHSRAWAYRAASAAARRRSRVCAGAQAGSDAGSGRGCPSPSSARLLAGKRSLVPPDEFGDQRLPATRSGSGGS